LKKPLLLIEERLSAKRKKEEDGMIM